MGLYFLSMSSYMTFYPYGLNTSGELNEWIGLMSKEDIETNRIHTQTQM